MAKFKEFQSTLRTRKKEKSLSLPAELVTHGSHSVEYADTKTTHNLSEKVAASEHAEYSEQEHSEIHNKIAPAYENSEVDKHHKIAVDAYSRNSRTLNKSLVGYHNGSDFDDRYKPHLEALDSLLSKKKTTADTHLYSGISWHPGKHLGKSGSAEVHLPAYTSMSTSINQAAGFAKVLPKSEHDAGHDLTFNSDDTVSHVLKVHVPKGTPAMSLMKHSMVPGEKEVLLHRGHELEVDHKPKPFVSKSGKIVNVWHARVVGHYPADIDQEDL